MGTAIVRPPVAEIAPLAAKHEARSREIHVRGAPERIVEDAEGRAGASKGIAK